eukprot:11781560-Alexandrium_andersonii.AAC.1
MAELTADGRLGCAAAKPSMIVFALATTLGRPASPRATRDTKPSSTMCFLSKGAASSASHA